MNDKIAKAYDAKTVEQRWYQHWEDKGYFKPKERKKDAGKYSIMMPPPNVTGQLHIGHALDMTWQDILIRFNRQKGLETVYIPGTDHAGIATQRRVRDQLAEEGIDIFDLGRDKFIDKVWQWKDQYGAVIIDQARQLGISCDWERESFTMDERCSEAVKEAFVTLYEKGLIYKGSYIVNWCPSCDTTISDIEVDHIDKKGKLYHVAYPLAEEDGEIIIATTRPETILGDVAVAVNPDDKRFKDYIGKECILPILNRKIPIIADDYVDMEFGTGALKITPGHDPNDFLVGKRHDLPEINIMNDDATINQEGGPYVGLDRYECRKAIIKDLENIGLLRNITDNDMSIGQCSRCDTVVEPLIKNQWFVKMEPLAKRAIEASENKEVEFVPERFEKIYLQWLDKIRDWCISRQLWWGHQIPAWYCACGEIIVSRDEPDQCPKCKRFDLIQDEDVLDTWFSSALWPFSTQDWPNTKVEDLEFYPTSTLVTGYDIIFFWVVRMITMGLELTDKMPFDTVLLHGLVRDSLGRKMSKSLDNGVDPLEVIKDFGADVLRFTLVTGNTPGNDMRFHFDRLESNRNFTNKIWNAARFIQLNLDDDIELGLPDEADLTNSDKWIISRFNQLVARITDVLHRHEFGEAARMLYDFLWSEFCDWYIEMTKPRLYSDDQKAKDTARSVLVTIFSKTLQLLHPFMPFITEELFTSLPHNHESIMIAPWPEVGLIDEDSIKDMNTIMDAIRVIRNLRQESDIKPSKKIVAYFLCEDKVSFDLFRTNEIYLKSLSNLSEVHFELDEDNLPNKEECLTAVVKGSSIYLPLIEAIDIDAEIDRLSKEEKRLVSEVKRASGKLANEKFVSKAPEKLVNEEKLKLADYQAQLDAVKKRVEELIKLKR
jgi:valyl-tRNA synthetase